MKILQSDIDCLIEVVQELRAVYACETVDQQKRRLTEMIHRTRKIYMLLLHANTTDRVGLGLFMSEGVSDDSPVALAVRSFEDSGPIHPIDGR
jgi:hypothetical protein